MLKSFKYLYISKYIFFDQIIIFLYTFKFRRTINNLLVYYLEKYDAILKKIIRKIFYIFYKNIKCFFIS